MSGGEIFVPKIPSMNILGLAKAIAPECEIRITGIRPGEKLHEVMVPKDDARHTLEFKDFYLIEPEFHFWAQNNSWNGGKRVPDDFEYSSDTNPWKLSIEAMREIINNL